MQGYGVSFFYLFNLLPKLYHGLQEHRIALHSSAHIDLEIAVS